MGSLGHSMNDCNKSVDRSIYLLDSQISMYADTHGRHSIYMHYQTGREIDKQTFRQPGRSAEN